MALFYYPPNHIHTADMFVCQLSAGIESVLFDQTIFNIVVAGDFNTLYTDYLVNNYGLWQLVNRTTHGRNIPDKFFCSQPDVYHASEYLSLVKPKHKAVLVQPLSGTGNDSRDFRPRYKVRLYDAHNIDRLRYTL
jgi:hypothetical protein